MLNANVLSQWDAMRGLCPTVAPHIVWNDQSIRGTTWFILQNEATGEHARFNATSHAIISRLDGRRKLDTILQEVNGLSFARCDEFVLVQLMMKLQRMGALVGFNFIDSKTLREDYTNMNERMQVKRWLNPLAVKINVFDPNTLLNRITPKLAWLFNATTLWVWSFVLVLALFTVMRNWGDVTYEFATRTLRLQTLGWFALLYPLLKFMHELAHALCVKYWGGQVRDVGISLLILIPVPYVDATDVYANHTRRQRIVLTAAGMGVEVFLASVSVLLWVWVEPGFLRDALFSVFIFGGVTTVFFNVNPLLKFDGYYLLQDVLDIPNLAARSSMWLTYSFKRVALGMKGLAKPFSSKRESLWLISYGVSVALYKPVLTLIIIGYLWRAYPMLGIVLGTFALFNQWLLPMYKGFKWMLTASELENQRSRAMALTFCSVCALTALLLVPLPSSTRVQGVVAASEQGEVFAETAGVITTVHVTPGAYVTEGSALVTLENPALARDLQRNQSELHALGADQVASLKRVEGANAKNHATTEAEHSRLLTNRDELYRQSKAMVITAQQEGTFAPISNNLLPGAHIDQGQRIGYVVSGHDWTVRTLVPESRAAQLRSGVKTASVRLAESIDLELSAVLVKETPAVTRELPSATLSQYGGGTIVTDPFDPSHRRALKNQFELELALPQSASTAGLGQRALVHLEHPAEPLITRLWRATRAVWLTRNQA